MSTSEQSAGGQRRRLKLGIVGIGVGAAEILPAMDAMEDVELVAGADLSHEVLERFKGRYPAANIHDSIEKLCDDANVEAVWISSPNRFHCPHALAAMRAGKHVVVEKPIALSLNEAASMVEAADKHGVKMLAGHTRSFSLPTRAMRQVIASNKLGRLCALNIWAYSDWMLRPRTADELDITQGGGVPYRQGPHQVDTVRLLGGGLVRSVRGMVGQWMPERPIPGYYSAFLEFEDGTPATIVHNGYGYFLGAELVPWGTSKQRYTLEERVAVRKSMRNGERDENQDKQDLRIGGKVEKEIFRRSEPEPWVPEDLGMVLVSCERGDIRHSQHGLFIYDDEGLRDISLTPEKEMGPSQRRAELEELYDAVVLGKPLFHDGKWGMATLEVCLAIMESAREHREIMLHHQVAVPAGHVDTDFTLD